MAEIMTRLRRLTGGVRFRTTALATLAVAVALAASGVALVYVSRAGLRDSVQATAETRAQDIAVLAEQDALPVPLPGRGDALVAQVVDTNDRVLSWTADIEGEGPLGSERLYAGQQTTRDIMQSDTEDSQAQGGAFGEQRSLLVARGVSTPNGTATVIVVASLGVVERSIGVFQNVLLIVLPLILAVTAVIVWLLTGRALAPVEGIRLRAAEISAAEPGRRVPVPPSTDEVHRLALTINEMLDRLEDSAERQRRFVGDASHELRSPVAAVQTMLDVAQLHPGSIDVSTLLEDMRRENTRLEALTHDMLTLARHAERAIDVGTSSVNLEHVLADEIASAGARSAVSVVLDACAPMVVVGDRAQLGRVFRNLLDNALRHAGSTVWVDAGVEGTEVIVRVSDDGAGISASDRERVFERFVRLDEGRARAEGGIGLGLAVCRALAEAHGGSARAVDPLHGGAMLEVRLPLA
ncbi:MAG: HAMP domain-containing sensor histidine kinase [Coriobacteriia bacterium]|nr:HAMP domain-containing sensor histidine kinase [Coriobacteriia bacterium]